MKISIFGLGYVGTVSAGCLANDGHLLIGIDPDSTKVDLINQGKSPVIEEQINELIQKAVADKKLSATTNPNQSTWDTEISIICVGTPSEPNGSLNLDYVRNVCKQIGDMLKNKNDFHVVVCRSTMLPGSVRQVVIPTLEKHSGKRADVDFGICFHPEFLREGSAVYDFNHPPKIVIGQNNSRSGDILADLYRHSDAPLIRTDIETAEMVKYTDNAWHATKVCFANEIGSICKALNIDGQQVMDIFCRDTKLNISSAYLKPGFAFGGSCLPKDLRALTYKAQTLDLKLPVLNAVLPSNKNHIRHGIDAIVAQNNREIGILGFSFKAGTNDLRESPMVEVIEYLLGKGYDIKIYDKNVNLAKLIGANKEYILKTIPHIAKLMVPSIEDILAHARTIVVGNNTNEFKDITGRLGNNQVVVDLVRITDKKSKDSQYEGICW